MADLPASQRRPTLADVAAAAGVSRATASRAMSGAPNVSPAAHDRVWAAVERLRFEPNRLARSLRSGSTMGVGFPKELRAALVEGEPEKFSLPSESDMRFHWVHVRLEAIDADEMRDLVENAWAMCAPKFLVEEYRVSQGYER